MEAGIRFYRDLLSFVATFRTPTVGSPARGVPAAQPPHDSGNALLRDPDGDLVEIVAAPGVPAVACLPRAHRVAVGC